MLVFGIVAIRVFGRWVMRPEAVPTRRGIASLWVFALLPWLIWIRLWMRLSLAMPGEPLGKRGEMAAIGTLIATVVWGEARIHAIKHAFASNSIFRPAALVLGIWILQSAMGYLW